MGAAIDLTGQQFGSLIVIERVGKYRTSIIWSCKCDCGNITQILSNALRRGSTKSCGCTQYDWLKERKPSMTHGGKKERLYRVWCGMIERCNNPNHNRFSRYGGRGIQVCSDWKNNYIMFRDWALSNGYNPQANRGECTIDRIDPDGSYGPENCRWVDMKVQNNNKRKEALGCK